MRYRYNPQTHSFAPWVDLQTALRELIEPDTIHTLDDAMRQFASEPTAPAGDYRIIEKGKRNPQRAYVVRRIQATAGFAVGGRTPKGKPQEPRQAQRLITEASQGRPVTPARWKLIQAGARASFHQFQVGAILAHLKIEGTLVLIRANIRIEPLTGPVDDRHRTVDNTFIAPMHIDAKTGKPWEEFIQAWKDADYGEATERWQEAYFAAWGGLSGEASIYNVEILYMQELEEAKRAA